MLVCSCGNAAADWAGCAAARLAYNGAALKLDCCCCCCGYCSNCCVMDNGSCDAGAGRDNCRGCCGACWDGIERWTLNCCCCSCCCCWLAWFCWCRLCTKGSWISLAATQRHIRRHFFFKIRALNEGKNINIFCLNFLVEKYHIWIKSGTRSLAKSHLLGNEKKYSRIFKKSASKQVFRPTRIGCDINQYWSILVILWWGDWLIELLVQFEEIEITESGPRGIVFLTFFLQNRIYEKFSVFAQPKNGENIGVSNSLRFDEIFEERLACWQKFSLLISARLVGFHPLYTQSHPNYACTVISLNSIKLNQTKPNQSSNQSIKQTIDQWYKKINQSIENRKSKNQSINQSINRCNLKFYR